MDSETLKKHYSPYKRTRIVTAYDLGVSPKEIALKEGIPAGSVRGITSRYRV
jgi:DNA-directed RNA polymerase specialized sigma24 family protein